MKIPADLDLFHKKGILPKSTSRQAGSAEVLYSAPSAGFKLLPDKLAQNIRTMRSRAKGRLTRNGFKTPFGVWVPKPLVKCVHEGVQDDFRDRPTTTDLERAIEGKLEEHRESLTGTVREIVAQAANDGICHPAYWKSTPTELRDIQHRYRDSYSYRDAQRNGWEGGNPDYDKTLCYIQKTLTERIEERLKSDIFISRVRRWKPRLIRSHVNLDDGISLAIFLSEVAWQVAEHLQDKRLRSGKRETRKAVTHLCQRLDARFVERPEALAELSSKLLDSGELAKNANDFFKAFGPPPYWLPIPHRDEVPSLLSATESDLSTSRFRFLGDASETARALEYDADDNTSVVFWMEEQGVQGFSYKELTKKASEQKWEDLTPEEESYWILEQLLERDELQSI